MAWAATDVFFFLLLPVKEVLAAGLWLLFLLLTLTVELVLKDS
jgi:hypothetical protein